ncbi:MAG: 4Fe-4S ferredoxin, partial [Candidatus Omnitrophica bacterium]|nr:4Fe-4S ferredoxin [Candidatus Omnitrophota bacterium]
MVKPKRIIIKEEYCIGCRLCEVYCITQHSPSRNIIKTYKGKGPKPVSGIYFEEKGSTSFAIQCRHCDEAP